MRSLRHLTAIGCSVLLLCLASVAFGQSQSSIAEALYQEGRQLMEAGKFAEACPKFAESHRLEPGMGTLLNLATCNEKLGKSATAWSQFSEAYSILTKETDEQRAAYAKERRDTLALGLSKVTIQVPDTSKVQGLTVTLDGVAVGSAVWGTAVPVDPGTHAIKAEAPGCTSWESTVEVAAKASQAVTIPLLRKVAAPPKVVQPVTTQPTQPSAPQDEASRPITAPVIIVGVVTVGLIVGAGVTGKMYIDRQSEYNELNGTPGADVDEVDRLYMDADAMGNLNLGLSIAAGVGVITTGILFFTRPKAAPQTAIAPWISHEAAGATLLKRF